MPGLVFLKGIVHRDYYETIYEISVSDTLYSDLTKKPAAESSDAKTAAVWLMDVAGWNSDKYRTRIENIREKEIEEAERKRLKDIAQRKEREDEARGFATGIYVIFVLICVFIMLAYIMR